MGLVVWQRWRRLIKRRPSLKSNVKMGYGFDLMERVVDWTAELDSDVPSAGAMAYQQAVVALDGHAQAVGVPGVRIHKAAGDEWVHKAGQRGAHT